MTSSELPDDLLDAIRSWVQAATGLDPGQVVAEGSPDPLPQPPFFVLRLTSIDAPVGSDELSYELNATQELQPTVLGQRRTLGALRVCGEGGLELLSRCALALTLPALGDVMQAHAITLNSTGPIVPVNDETTAELPAPVFERPIALDYALKLSSTDVEPHFERFVLDVELDADPHFTDPLMVTLEAD